MNLILTLVAVLFYLLVPAAVVCLCRHARWAGKVGAILILYFLGLIVANLLVFPVEGAAAQLYPLQDALTSVTIPLALPLILFACDFRNWPVRKALMALIIGLFSVLVVATAGYFLFRDHLGEQAPSIAGMIVGVYTGGTPNLAAIKMMLGVDEGTYVLMNSFDMLVSFLFLVFLLAASGSSGNFCPSLSCHARKRSDRRSGRNWRKASRICIATSSPDNTSCQRSRRWGSRC